MKLLWELPGVHILCILVLASEVVRAQPFRPASYKVDLDLPATERWRSVLAEVLDLYGTSPFFRYYSAVQRSEAAAFPQQYAYFQAHIGDWQAAYAERFPDALAELNALADILQSRAETAEERGAFSREQVLFASLQMQIFNTGTPKQGECTSVIARSADGLVHFRNWDFGPLPELLGLLSVEVQFYFSQSKRQGFRCLLALTHIDKWTTCMKEGAFSMSLNAREFGEGHERGRLPEVELELLRAGRLPRVAVLRNVMLSDSYEAAVHTAATANALTSMYIILAGHEVMNGSQQPAGVVVTLMSNTSSSDVLKLPQGTEGWFLVQTNVDHWLPMSDNRPSSHRREHVKALLHDLGPAASVEELYSLLRDPEPYPADNTGPDDGKVFRDTTIASVLMRPWGLNSADPSAWHADVWKRPVIDAEPTQLLV